MATNSREARRRKIMERGSDRLALITGRIQSLPDSSSSPDPTTHREDTPPPPSPPSISHVLAPQTHLPDQIPAVAREIEEEEVFRAIDSSTAENAPSFSPSPVIFDHRSHFTPSKISTAIEATESTRLYTSAALALLVVLTHLGSFPLLGSKLVKTLLGFRPLYLVLLTNVTLVVARILGGRKRATRVVNMFDEAMPPPVASDGYEWVDYLGKALGLGLVVKNVVDALFMDCAVYTIIVVCGLSFLQ